LAEHLLSPRGQQGKE